jgi:hypothetical protein
VDESGDFGAYEPHSPFYLLTLVFHDNYYDITPNLLRLKESMNQRGIPDYTVHAGPLIRRDNEYREFSLDERKEIFDCLFHFVRTANISYHTILIEKKKLAEEIDLVVQITKKLSAFLFEHLESFQKHEHIIVNYDYGQRELTNILVSVFNTVLNNVEFKKIAPANNKLFQAADMFCAFELLSLKAERKMLSNSEIAFFSSVRTLNKSYLRTIQKKRYQIQ